MKVNILFPITVVFSLSFSSLSFAFEQSQANVSETKSNFSFGLSAGLSNYQNPLIDKNDLKIPLFPKFSWTNNEDIYIDNLEIGYLAANFENSLIEIVGMVNHDGLYHLDTNKGFLPPLVINPSPNDPIFDYPDDPNLSYMGGARYSHLLNQDKELITAAIYTDVSGQHNGQQLDLTWTHIWTRSTINFSSELSLHYKSTDLLEYYYGGPLDNGQVSSKIQLDAGYVINEDWMLVVNFSREFLSDAIRSSELVEVSHLDSFFAGVTWKW